jgi:dTDP-4-amino-4,6-dideoxygalactose transaminase
VEGYNGRLDAIQAAILRVKLRQLAAWNEQRRASARIYDELLAPLSDSVLRPFQSPQSKSVYHLYVVRTQFRNELREYLREAEIGTGIHYPIPIHLQAAYSAMGWRRGDYPESEAAAEQVLSLPMFAGLTEQQQKQVVETIAKCAISCVGE